MARALLLMCLFIPGFLWAQTAILTGSVADAMNGEPILSAVIKYGADKGFVVDVDGNFSVEIPYGQYQLVISSMGYSEKNLNITINQPLVEIQIELVGDQNMQSNIADFHLLNFL